jgi:hypothetical protein
VKYYTGNVEEVVDFADFAGNVGSGVVKITWIVPPSS